MRAALALCFALLALQAWGPASMARGWERIGCGAPCEDAPQILRLYESVAGNEDVYEATLGPQQGWANDLAYDPGWSREPNSPPRVYRDAAGATHAVAEQFPGAAYGDCDDVPVGDARNPTAGPDAASREAQHRGWCNVGPSGLGGAYAAQEVEARGWMDVHAVRTAVLGSGIVLQPHMQVLGFGKPFLRMPGALEAPAGEFPDAAEHTRTLGPGNYVFMGPVGGWRDAPFVNDESLFPDPAGTTLVTYPPDAWVGSAARATGQWHYRGFLPLTCTTDADAADAARVHEAAECNPYLGGGEGDPQDYTDVELGGEFLPVRVTDCYIAGGEGLRLAPTDGAMNTQLLVVRDWHEGMGPFLPLGSGFPRVEAYGPGPVDPLELRVGCYAGVLTTLDVIVWPTGNVGDDLVTFLTRDVRAAYDAEGRARTDTVTDVDFYAGWGLPSPVRS